MSSCPSADQGNPCHHDRGSDRVWPWITQIGQGRGGFYSCDFIENLMGLDIHTANRILPEYQSLNVGDLIPLASDGFGVPVAIVEPPCTLVAHERGTRGHPSAPAIISMCRGAGISSGLTITRCASSNAGARIGAWAY
jgi:hypothetical protein